MKCPNITFGYLQTNNDKERKFFNFDILPNLFDALLGSGQFKVSVFGSVQKHTQNCPSTLRGRDQ